MIRSWPFLALILLVIAVAASDSAAQSSAPAPPLRPPGRDSLKDDTARTTQEMLTRRRIEQDRKEYEQLLERGDRALELATELESAVAESDRLTPETAKKLAELEKLVRSIRSDLGGSGDEKGAEAEEAEARDTGSSTLQDSFSFLKEKTATLVDELKRGSRFTVSVIAIQTSNTVLRVARFLRFGK